MTALRRTATLAIGGVSLLGALTGCSTVASTGGSSSGGSDTSTESSGSTAGPYTDGDYTATGTYQSPGGTETIDVELTLAGDIVTDVTVTGNASSGNAERYQSEFADGISAEVVGQSLDDISVDKIAGSSLTSNGFMDALDQIKADAVA